MEPVLLQDLRDAPRPRAWRDSRHRRWRSRSSNRDAYFRWVKGAMGSHRRQRSTTFRVSPFVWSRRRKPLTRRRRSGTLTYPRTRHRDDPSAKHSWLVWPSLKEVGPGSQDPASGSDRGDQRFDPDDVHDPCQIIGQDRESHLGGYFWKRFGVEVRRPPCGPSSCRTDV